MNHKLELDALLAQQRERVRAFCREADLELQLAERWIEDQMNLEKHGIWLNQRRRVEGSLNDWKRASDAFLNALRERL